MAKMFVFVRVCMCVYMCGSQHVPNALCMPDSTCVNCSEKYALK